MTSDNAAALTSPRRHHGRTIVPHGCLNLDAHNVEWIFNFSQPGDIVDVRYAGSLPGSVGVVRPCGFRHGDPHRRRREGLATISLVTRPCSLVNSSITSKESAIFCGVSMTMVTTGT